MRSSSLLSSSLLERRRLNPVLTLLLVLLNLAVFGLELALSGDRGAFIQRWGLVSADVTLFWQSPSQASPAVLITLVSNAFVHASWLHLLANLVYLWVFGRPVEERLGHEKFVALYILCTLASSLVQLLVQPLAAAPAVGASGAISGLIAANLVMRPPTVGSVEGALFSLSNPRKVPSWLLLVLWLVIQVIGGAASIAAIPIEVAWWAHAGGFLAGLILTPVIQPSPRRRW